MILADYIAIGLVLLFGTIGTIVGFGKGLKFFTKGIIGILISVVVCYFLLGIVLNFGFVQKLTLRFVDYLGCKDNAFCKFLLTIRIEIIAVAVALFVLVQILRKLIVLLIAKVMETDNAIIKVINKTFGAVLSIAILIGLALIVMQITYFVIGERGSVWFEGSFFRLDVVYLNNPLTSIINI